MFHLICPELSTYAVAPAVAGLLFTSLGFGVTGLLLAAWNLASVVLEYSLLARIYRGYPQLAEKEGREEEREEEERMETEREEEGRKEGEGEGKEEAVGMGAWQGWTDYFHHPVMKVIVPSINGRMMEVVTKIFGLKSGESNGCEGC